MNFNKIAIFFFDFLYLIKRYEISKGLKLFAPPPPIPPIWHIHFSAPRTVLPQAAAPLAPLFSVTVVLHCKDHETVRAAAGTRGFPSLQHTRSCRGDWLRSNSRGCAVRADVWLIYIQHNSPTDRLCGLVVRVSGYRYRGLGFDSRRYQIFWVVVGLERGPLSLVRSTEELLE